MKTEISSQQISKREPRGYLTINELPESGEVEISKEATTNRPVKRIRFPKEKFKHFQMMPHQFVKTRNAIDEYEKQERRTAVFANSIESVVGYNSLIRTLGKYFLRQVAYYRSEAGGRSVLRMLGRKFTNRIPLTKKLKRYLII